MTGVTLFALRTGAMDFWYRASVSLSLNAIATKHLGLIFIVPPKTRNAQRHELAFIRLSPMIEA